MTEETSHAISEFVERMGLIAQGDGLPRIAGRILGLFVVEGGPFSFAELTERLQVSRASVSTNTRLLENLNVLERTAMPGERQDYFRLTPQPYARMLRGYADRMGRARAVIAEAHETLPRHIEGAHDRLGELDAFYEALIASFLNVIENWEARNGAVTAEQNRETTGNPV